MARSIVLKHACTQAHTQPHVLSLSHPHARAHTLKRTQPMQRCKPCACTLSSASWHSPLPSFNCSCAVLLMVESQTFPRLGSLVLSLSHPRHLSFSLFLTYPSGSREASSLSMSSVVASASHKLAPTLTFFLGPSFSQQPNSSAQKHFSHTLVGVSHFL